MSDSDAGLPSDVAERIRLARDHALAGRVDQAAYAVRKFPPRYAGHPRALAAAGLTAFIQGDVRAALGLLLRVRAAAPDDAEITLDLGRILVRLGRGPEALALVAAFHEAHPLEVDPLRFLSELSDIIGDLQAMKTYSDKLAALTPDTPESIAYRSQQYLNQRRYPEALAELEALERVLPLDRRVHNTRIFVLLMSGAEPLAVRAAAERASTAMYGDIADSFPRRKRPRSGRLRIGYLSGDFCDHVVSRFIAGVLPRHDRSRVWVAAYSNTPVEDAVTRRIAASVELWRPISGLPHAQAVELIRRDELDVLIDLGGHTSDGRLALLAARVAPAQANYLGFPATTGLKGVDFRITDALADPPGLTEAFHSERLMRLPRCAWAYEPAASHRPIDPPEPRAGPVFGSFNLLAKISRATVSLWGRALAGHPGAPPLLLADRRGSLSDPRALAELHGEFASAGLDAGRVTALGWVPDSAAHVERHAGIDVALDPLSYNGTTTTCEALFAGVPVLTLPGRSHVERVGASLLSAAGLERFIARDEQDFLRRLWELNDAAELWRMRDEIRRRAAGSPLADPTGLARALEQACAEMATLTS